MKIIIDISEDDLNAIKFLKIKGWANRHELLILDGIPFDNIRNEIENIEIEGHIRDVECFNAGVNTALNIIDKYR